MHARCSFLWSIVRIATGLGHDSKQTRVKTAHFHRLRATGYTDSLDMVVLPSTGITRYHNCCIVGSTTLENFGYHLVLLQASHCHIDSLNIRIEISNCTQDQWRYATTVFLELILNSFKKANTNKTDMIYTFISVYYVYVTYIAEKLCHPEFLAYYK